MAIWGSPAGKFTQKLHNGFFLSNECPSHASLMVIGILFPNAFIWGFMASPNYATNAQDFLFCYRVALRALLWHYAGSKLPPLPLPFSRDHHHLLISANICSVLLDSFLQRVTGGTWSQFVKNPCILYIFVCVCVWETCEKGDNGE